MSEQLVTRKALFTGSTVDVEKRTAEVIFSTGAGVLRTSWDGTFIEELSMSPEHVRMGRLNSGAAPLLVNHDGADVDSVIGVIERAWFEGTNGIAKVRFASDPEADKIFQRVIEGIIKNVSVGYRIHKMERASDDSAEVQIFRAIDWEPHEISVVAIGADANAHFRSSTFKGVSQMENNKQDLAKNEQSRAAGIQESVRVAGLEAGVANDLIAQGVPLADARATILEIMATRNKAINTDSTRGDGGYYGRVQVGTTSNEKFVKGASALIFAQAGNDLVGEAKRRNLTGFENVELDPGEFRGWSMVDLATECLTRAGVRTRGLGKNDIVATALSQRSGMGYQMAGDFEVLLESAMGKILLAAYATQADTWSRVCSVQSVEDFRDSPRYRSGSFGTLPVVLPGAEYQNITVPDGLKTSINVDTHGGIIALSRQAIVNDDMGAINDEVARFGRSAKLSIESDFYALLALNSGLGPTMSDSQPFFHSNRANVSTSAALTAAALDLDRQKMRRQQDISSNEYLDLNPRIALVPVELEAAMKILNTDAYDPAQAGQKSNISKGMFSEIVSSPRISWSTTRRYLFAEGGAAVVCAFLNGQQAPYLEQKEGFRRDGIEWKARIDYKVQVFDPKAAVTNAGT